MSSLQRGSKLLEAKINRLLGSAEDPELLLEQLAHEMEEALVELRRETVDAVARQKQLARKVQAAEQIAAELEQDASLALDHDNAGMARAILLRRTEILRRGKRLSAELERATAVSRQVKAGLIRMQEQVELVRRTKDGMSRQARAAAARLRTEEVAPRPSEALERS